MDVDAKMFSLKYIFSASMLLVKFSLVLTQKSTTYSTITFSLLHCDNSLSRSPVFAPDPHNNQSRSWSLIKLDSPTTNTTQYVSPSPGGFPYAPYAGSNMTAFFW